MSDREHTRPLRDFRGELERPKAIVHLEPIGPWRASVTVTPLQLRGIGTRWQVVARWHGPPLPGSPPAAGPVWATDTLVVDGRALAQAVARRAADDLRAPRVPDLRAAAQRFRNGGK